MEKFVHTIIGGGVSQEKLEEAPRPNVERLVRWLNKHGHDIRIDPSMTQKQLASNVYWSLVPPTCTMYS